MPLKMPPLYVRASIATAFVTMLWGIDTSSVGPVTSMSSFKSSFGSFPPTVHGAIVSSMLVTGTFSALVAGVLADQHGRVSVISAGAAIYALGAALECGAVHLAMFVAGRAVKGAGTGLFVSTVSVQLCEITPAKVRGFWVAFSQFLLTVGLVLGYFVCYATGRIENSSASWRVPLAIQSALALIFAITVVFVPPSPRWLLSKGREEEAKTIMRKLGFSQDEQAETLSQPTPRQNMRSMLSDFRTALSQPYRSRTLFGIFLMTAQQLSGINGVLYYSPLMFRQAGLPSEEASFLASGVTAVVICAVTIPATIFADAWGRKTSTLIGGVGICVTMFVMGSLYAANQVHEQGAGRWVVIVCIYLFNIAFNATWAVSFRTYLVESLPRETRSSGAALAQVGNWAADFVVAFATPPFLAASGSGPYFSFGGCTAIAVAVCAVWMVETRLKSLESIEADYLKRGEKGACLVGEREVGVRT
ncbi:MFS sugar transporter [Colletotrichum plurivorum]|uniref:MFS sugar transporter n=1 Tax=Colletotrichum plurivorum TaxID=2175906 RepID=A0A8H6NAW2_9PEZI|nr:MFS sugar transporter [Colletotrichum plurivorum]